MLLVGLGDRLDPTDSLRSIQLNGRLCFINGLDIVHYADLDDLATWKGCSVTEQGRAAISAEMACNLVATIGLFGIGLGLARCDFETVFWDDDVGRVGATGDFSAVGAVAEGL